MLPLSATLRWDDLRVRAPSGALLHGLLLRPRRTRAPLPTVVLLPGGLGAGRTMTKRPGALKLARAGMAVVGFNAEGRCSGKLGDPRSEGTNDFNGHRDQDGLAAVIHTVARHPAVDGDRIGLYALSFGLVAAAGCLARHPELPVRYLADEEGPADCASALLRAWSIEGEDADWCRKAQELFGHADPQRSGAARDAAFWAQREPVRSIGAFRGHYLRLQAQWDHVQPPKEPSQVARFHQPPRWWHAKHACQLVAAALDGGVPWVRVNLPEQSNPVGARFDAQQRPHLVPGSMEEHPDLWVRAVAELAGIALRER